MNYLTLIKTNILPSELRRRAAAQRNNVPRTRKKHSWEDIWWILVKTKESQSSGNPLFDAAISLEPVNAVTGFTERSKENVH